MALWYNDSMNFFKRNKKPTTQASTQDENVIDLQNNAQLLVDAAPEYNLDYSTESLAALDTMLDEASQSSLDDQTMKLLITQAGSYIFEVARRKYGGKLYWYDELNQPILVIGQPEFELSFLAFEKVKGRLQNGSEDNIPFFFDGIEGHIRDKRSAMIV